MISIFFLPSHRFVSVDPNTVRCDLAAAAAVRGRHCFLVDRTFFRVNNTMEINSHQFIYANVQVTRQHHSVHTLFQGIVIIENIYLIRGSEVLLFFFFFFLTKNTYLCFIKRTDRPSYMIRVLKTVLNSP